MFGCICGAGPSWSVTKFFALARASRGGECSKFFFGQREIPKAASGFDFNHQTSDRNKTMNFGPVWLTQLADQSIKTILLTGCGGGYDFVHACALIPWLSSLNKRVIIHSYSFGDPAKITGDCARVFSECGVDVRLITRGSVGAPHYAPEVHAYSFVTTRHPNTLSAMYASYARDWTIPTLQQFYQWLVSSHNVDAVVAVDGGSDSLVRGDEPGLGDPIEDATTLGAVANLATQRKILLTIGLGADRFNQVADMDSLRSIAELTAMGGYLGSWGLTPNEESFVYYRSLVQYLEEKHTFRSVLANAIVESGCGHFGPSVPEKLSRRVSSGELYLWPLMPIFWGFDLKVVAQFNQVVRWIEQANSPQEAMVAVHRNRLSLGAIAQTPAWPQTRS